MPNIFVVRAEFGKYIRNFIRGGYAAVGWMPETDLTAVENREELEQLFEYEHPEHKNNLIIGRQLAQIERFLLEMNEGDFVITPDNSTETVHYGIVEPNPSYYYFTGADGCPFRHRRKVDWTRKGIEEKEFSTPFHRAIRSPMDVFQISPDENNLNISPEKIWF